MTAYDQVSVVPKAKGAKIIEKKNRLFENLRDMTIMSLMNSNNHHNYNKNHLPLH